jgi:hypothetical protein
MTVLDRECVRYRLRSRPSGGFSRVRLAVSAWWRAPGLDRQLAAGASPQESMLLALRARRITSRRGRGRVGDGLARAMRDARATRVGFSAAVGPDRRELLAARTVLGALERRLRGPEPVGARGVALLYVLLSDGSSPLYRPGERGALGSALRAAAAALELADARQLPRAASQVWQRP